MESPFGFSSKKTHKTICHWQDSLELVPQKTVKTSLNNDGGKYLVLVHGLGLILMKVNFVFIILQCVLLSHYNAT
jgi:hypothetical protein